MKKLFAFVALSPLLVGEAHAQLFTPNGSFTVTGVGSPADFSDSATLTVGTTQSFVTSNGTLTLTVETAPGTDGNNAEWLIFNYNTLNGQLLSPSQGNWSLNEIGLPAVQALKIQAGFVQFDAGASGPVTFISSPFSNFSPVSGPPPALTSLLSGPGLLAAAANAPIGGPGPLPSLGTFIDPFNLLDNDLMSGQTADTLTGYTEALEFSSASVSPTIPEPRTWVMMLLGFAGIGFAAFRRSTKARFAVG